MVTILNYQEKMIIHWPPTENGLAHSTDYGMNLLSQENAE